MKATKNEILKANIREHAKEAEYYDLIHTEIFNTYEQRRINKVLKKILKNYNKSSHILEIGAGTGNLTKKLVDNGFENIICVDLSKEMLEILNNKIKSKKIRFVVDDIDSFILNNNKSKFDIILTSSVLHHLPDYEKTIRNLKRILNKNGVIYATHEPYKMKSEPNLLNNVFTRVDYYIYLIRYIILIALGRLKYLKRDCSVSDYHTGDNAIQVSKINRLFDKESYVIEVNYYAVAKNSITAFVLNKYK